MLAAINFHRHNVERLKVWAGDFGEGGVWCFIYNYENQLKGTSIDDSN